MIATVMLAVMVAVCGGISHASDGGKVTLRLAAMLVEMATAMDAR
jgi:hypothetical protein